MALGAARLFNIRLTQNFNSPYLATSIADFWRRWHISFSRWILDYIFKPLQMGWRNWRDAGTALALLVTFLICGLWHGISWGFVVWGALHGLYMATAIYWRPFQKRLHKAFRVEKTLGLRLWQTLVTFHLICVAWVFFRANTLGDALHVISSIFICRSSMSLHDQVLLGLGSTNLVILCSVLIAMVFISIVVNKFRNINFLAETPTSIRWLLYYVLLSSIILLGSHKHSQFLYLNY